MTEENCENCFNIKTRLWKTMNVMQLYISVVLYFRRRIFFFFHCQRNVRRRRVLLYEHIPFLNYRGKSRSGRTKRREISNRREYKIKDRKRILTICDYCLFPSGPPPNTIGSSRFPLYDHTIFLKYGRAYKYISTFNVLRKTSNIKWKKKNPKFKRESPPRVQKSKLNKSQCPPIYMCVL